MSENYSPFQFPLEEITERDCPSISIYHEQAMAVAGAFFDVGGTTMCRARFPKYQGNEHRPTDHRLGLMVQGRMEFRFGKHTIVAEPGDWVCAPAGTVTQRKALEPIEWIYFAIDDLPMWTPLKKAGPTIRRYESPWLMYSLVKEVLAATRSHDLESIRCASESAGMVVKLLERDVRRCTNESKSKRLDGLVDLIDQIRREPALDWSRTAMAHEIGRSERHLTQLFDDTFGLSPGKMLIRIRMEHAMTLLKESTDSVEDIGKSVGYDNIYSFSRAFKKYQSMSPGAFRKLFREE